MSIKLANAIAEVEAAPSVRTSRDRHLCDAALAAYRSLPRWDWKGRHVIPGGEIVFEDAERAQACLAAGKHALDVNDDPTGAIALLDAAIRLDHTTALTDAENLVTRAFAFHALGNEAPWRSILLYDLGVNFAHLRQWREAGTAYWASASLDPGFVWPLNNFAWMAATATDTRAHDGEFAVTLAQRACLVSQWGCGCFLGTLAASYARVGDFGRAVAWQRITVDLADAEGRSGEIARLHCFASGTPFVDHHPRPVGGDLSSEELKAFDLEVLRQQLQELTAQRPATVH